ncbi:hypothetical protein [Natronomonas sp. EA1]|uniref:hypothetical protein n=1 Tax=Natronomonas sp. EA1 TaxID=3421655 RepID=UPI003EB9BDA4
MYGDFENGDEAPGDEVRRIIEEADGLSTRGVATTLGMPEHEAEEVIEELSASGEIERDGDGLWVAPGAGGPDDPYIF